MRLQEITLVQAPPDRVFAFFEQMDRLYLAWHPDHVSFAWGSPARLAPGAIFRFEERIGGTLMRKEVRITRLVPGRLLEFAPTSRLMRLFLPEIGFLVEPDSPGCSRLVAYLTIRTGPIGAWLNRREFDAVRRHMAEEGVNLKRLVEAITPRAGA